MQEEKVSTSSHFITLTYDTEHVPIVRRGMSLRKRDVQLFFKRLRKANRGSKIRYYLAGEYGTDSFRPHYHIILFNVALSTINGAWNLGTIHYGEVSGASIGYTLKYISKPKRVPVHKGDDRLPEFSLMSKGLGKNYLTSQMLTWHKNDLENRMYLNLKDGKKCTMPRYYKDKIYTEHERDLISEHQLVQIIEKTAIAYEQSDVNTQQEIKEATKLAFDKMNASETKKNKI